MSLPSNFNHNVIRLNVRCPICGDVYDWQRLKILGERDQQVLTFIDCNACATAVLSILSMGPNGMSAQGLVTDLTVEEVFDYSEESEISSDDVLAMHEMLEKNSNQLFVRD